MTYKGHIRNGVVVPDTPVMLPEGTPVRIEAERIDSEFWQNLSIEELAGEQGVEPCTDPADLACDWPPDESIDEFLTLIKRSRV